MANTETSTEGKVTHVADDIENEDSDIDVDYDWTTRSCKKYETKSLDNNVNTAHVDVSYDNINVDVVDTVHTYNNKLDHEWVTMYTSDGRVYYQNNTTKKTQWNKPMEMEQQKQIRQPIPLVQPLPVVQPIPLVQPLPVVTIVQNDTNTPKYQQQIRQSRTETIVVHYVPQETIPKETELTVIQSEENNESNTKKRKRRSTIGEKNLEKRSQFEIVFNIIGIILAIVSIGFTTNDIFTKYSMGDNDNYGDEYDNNYYNNYGNNHKPDCEQFNVDPQIFMLALIMFPLGFISLLINIVEYKSGDCACLRHCLMNILCLTWTKLCCCYDKTSVKLLMVFNTLFWFIMFILEIIGIFLFYMANQKIDAYKEISFDCEKNEIEWDTYLEGTAICLGFIVSIIELFYSGVGKCMLKMCCFVCVVGGIVGIVGYISLV